MNKLGTNSLGYEIEKVDCTSNLMSLDDVKQKQDFE